MQREPSLVDLGFLADTFRVLGDPKRLLIFHTLMEGVQCNCELGETLDMAPNLVSHHLRLLREAGLIEAARDEFDARWIYYSVNPKVLESFSAAFGIVFAAARIKPRRASCGPSHGVFYAGESVDHAISESPTVSAAITHTGNQPMPRTRVIFVCIHNSARSQMAEAWLNTLFGDEFVAESAGLEPGVLNPLAVRVLQEEGIDISQKETRDVFDVYKAGRLFDYIVTVCDETAAERCPVFPGLAQRLHWSFTDPSSVQGTEEEKLAQVRVIRDQIRSQIEAWAPIVMQAVD